MEIFGKAKSGEPPQANLAYPCLFLGQVKHNGEVEVKWSLGKAKSGEPPRVYITTKKRL